jgi:hypothetical protein
LFVFETGSHQVVQAGSNSPSSTSASPMQGMGLQKGTTTLDMMLCYAHTHTRKMTTDSVHV